MTTAIPILEQWSTHRLGTALNEIVPTGDILKVVGPVELTAANCETFGQQIRAALNGHNSIEIDLSLTIFMDCAGLGSLIALRKFVRSRNAVMRLMYPTPAVRQLFAILCAGELFEIINLRPANHANLASHPAPPLVSLGPLAVADRPGASPVPVI